MTLQIRKAERRKRKAKYVMEGPSGAGKTHSNLLMLHGLVGPNGKILVADTENASADLEAGKPGIPNFDVVEIVPPYTPDKYIEVINEAIRLGYDALDIDSLSHEWEGKGGMLEQHSLLVSTGKYNNFTAWKPLTPKHQELLEAIIQAPIHIGATMRAKEDYQYDEQSKKVKKMGAAPIQRPGTSYEFDVVFDLSIDQHVATATKNRLEIFKEPFVITVKSGQMLREWLDAGVDAPAPTPLPEPERKVEPKPIEPDKKEAKSNGFISASQVTRFWAIARKNFQDDEIKKVLQSIGVNSSKEIKTQYYEVICSWADKQLTEDDLRLAMALPIGDAV